MLGDVLIITEKHKIAADIIYKKILEIDREKVILAISGESGSGKSELAYVIAKHLKQREKPAKILHTDDYYIIPPNKRASWRMEHGLESIGLGEYNWNLINQNIADFKQDKEAELPCIDLLTDQVDKLITNFKGIKYLILEGLYSIKIKADFKVFIDLTYQDHDTKKAQLVPGKEPQNLFRMQVLQREHENVQLLKHLADIIVTKEFNVLSS